MYIKFCNYISYITHIEGGKRMKKTVITLLAAGTMLGAPFSTVFAEEQVSQQEAMDKMEVLQKIGMRNREAHHFFQVTYLIKR